VRGPSVARATLAPPSSFDALADRQRRFEQGQQPPLPGVQAQRDAARAVGEGLGAGGRRAAERGVGRGFRLGVAGGVGVRSSVVNTTVAIPRSLGGVSAIAAHGPPSQPRRARRPLGPLRVRRRRRRLGRRFRHRQRQPVAQVG